MFDRNPYGALLALANLAPTPRAEVFDPVHELVADVDERQRLLDFLAGREAELGERARIDQPTARPTPLDRHRVAAALVLIAEEAPLWQAG